MADDDLTVRAPGSGELPDRTREQLTHVLEEYCRLVQQEAGRFEAGSNTSEGPPMITPAHISDADTSAKKGYVKPRQSKASVSYAALSYLFAILAGIFGNNLMYIWGGLGLCLCTALGIIFCYLGVVKQ